MNNNRERKSLVHSPLGWALGISVFMISLVGSANLAIMLVSTETDQKSLEVLEGQDIRNIIKLRTILPKLNSHYIQEAPEKRLQK